jgi:hypothetical protein
MNPLWSATSNFNLDRLFRLQKKCLRFIQRKAYDSASVSLFSERILPLTVVNDYNLLVLAFKLKHNLIKNNIVLRYVNEIHSQSTRYRFGGNFYIIPYQTQYGLADFYRRGLIKFNELDDPVKRISSLALFKDAVRTKLLNNYLAENR